MTVVIVNTIFPAIVPSENDDGRVESVLHICYDVTCVMEVISLQMSGVEFSESLTKIPQNHAAEHATSIAKDTIALMQRKYDAQVKAFLAHKEILAPILKSCVEELAVCSLTEIMDSIQNVQVSQIPVHREDTINIDVQPLIVGANTEDETADEGTVRYDLLIYVNVPGDDGKAIRVIINIEAQQKDNPGYPLIRRAVYYASRMISAQKNREFTKSDYGNIKKVYSIWICYSSENDQNTMTRYRITQDDMIGHVETDRRDYDLLQVIMVRLGKPSETADRSLLHLLDVAFSSEIKLSDKLLTMADMYGIPMTEAFGEELNVMCNWGEGIWERAVKETTTKMMEQMNIEIDHKNKEIEQKDREIEQKDKVIEQKDREIEQKEKAQAWDMYSDHMPPEVIAKYLRRPLEVVCSWLGFDSANM